jgi:hypothetical protein
MTVSFGCGGYAGENVHDWPVTRAAKLGENEFGTLGGDFVIAERVDRARALLGVEHQVRA